METLEAIGDMLVQTFGNHSSRSPFQAVVGEVVCPL